MEHPAATGVHLRIGLPDADARARLLNCLRRYLIEEIYWKPATPSRPLWSETSIESLHPQNTPRKCICQGQSRITATNRQYSWHEVKLGESRTRAAVRKRKRLPLPKRQAQGSSFSIRFREPGFLVLYNIVNVRPHYYVVSKSLLTSGEPQRLHIALNRDSISR